MELASKYSPAEVEGKWYQYWTDHKLFSSKPDGREPYTIVIPPPNVTGVLHMGHMLNNTIQDILVRRARMEGKNACWVPGTDHASIATEAKVVKKLAGEGIKKRDLTREQFLQHAWDWTHEHGGIILKQLRKLGASCDWDRTAFTMDEERSKSDTGRTLYILDEPTTGLHFEDIRILLGVLQKLVDKGNTVLVIEHNMDVIKVADWVIDLGPDGGRAGGRITFCGTPEDLAKQNDNFTGHYLAEELAAMKQ